MARETRNTVITETVVTDPLLAADECCKILGCSKPTFWRWVSLNFMPKPVKLGRFSRWPRSEILDAIEKAKAARQIVA
ncbi:MAG: AlpA family transcriptional regulator [Xanthobacteraceae bacterium]|nr:AlpA family transcriptional regulator [Xanthobacteraceae bacterium]